MIDGDDPLLWLEDLHGERSMQWVRERNRESLDALQSRADYAPTRAALLEVLNSKDRIPSISRRGDHVYNLWHDQQHLKGLWRRTTLEDYMHDEPRWETVLDLDALGRDEGENWVWAGAHSLGPQHRRCLVSLSRGGADAAVVREFDLHEKRFIAGGFFLPEAKSDVTWIDDDTVFIATDFGPGSLTDSGYPRVVKRWRRGTPLDEAQTVFEAETKDVSAWVFVDRTPGFERTVVGRSIDFYSTRAFLLDGDGAAREIDKPLDAAVSFQREWLLLELRSDWHVRGTAYRQGSLLAAQADAYLAGDRNLHVLFEPSERCSLNGHIATRSQLVLNLLDQVSSRLEERRWDGRAWQGRAVAAPAPGTIGVASLHDPLLDTDPLGDRYLVSYTDFLTPDSLLIATAGCDDLHVIKRRSAHFDAQGMRAEQRFAVSSDGTRIPYFVVWPKHARPDGRNATLLYGYGGFEVSLQPWYSGGQGRAWYEHGGVFVVANIRGGGEFGPAWHQAAVGAQKSRSHDDFIAVAEDLIASGITSPSHLGIMGGSNGGLLVASVALRRPDLFAAVVCQVPLLDMRRYHRLLAGASWIAEYGNPDVEVEWSWMRGYSPYQNIRAEARYPAMLYTTSTRDDRVHPGHARKMVARMMELGHEVLYHENIEGGHGGAADNEQRAHVQALEFAFLGWRLGLTADPSPH